MKRFSRKIISKRAVKQIIILINIVVLSTKVLSAQYAYQANIADNDSINCLMNISVYKEFQKMKLYDKAIPEWAKTYNNCPGFKKIIYQDGVRFLHFLIPLEHDKEKKGLLVDSLMHIYDARIKYFGQAGYVNGRKGIDLYRFDKSSLMEARRLLDESVKELVEKSRPQVLLGLMLTTFKLSKQKKLTKNELNETYYLCVGILDKQLEIEKNEKNLNQIAKAKVLIESEYIKAGFANCDDLETFLLKKYKADSCSVPLILKIQSTLKSAACLHSNLYYKTALQLHKLQKNAKNSYLLAGFSLKNGRAQEAASYLKEALKLEKSDSLKAGYYIDLGTIYYTQLEKFEEGRDYANEAIKLNAYNGRAYILLGDIYAAFSHFNGKNNFEHSVLYWLAVDQYKKAKTVDASLTKKADEKIAYYRQKFPTAEDAFFYGYSKGQGYKFGSWINETTLVR